MCNDSARMGARITPSGSSLAVPLPARKSPHCKFEQVIATTTLIQTLQSLVNPCVGCMAQMSCPCHSGISTAILYCFL